MVSEVVVQISSTLQLKNYAIAVEGIARVSFPAALLVFISLAQLCLGQDRAAIERTELGNLQNYYATLDPHYANVIADLPELKTALNDLKASLTATQAAHPNLQANFSPCIRAVDVALRRTESALRETEQVQYGNVRAVLSASAEQDENRLAKVLACVGDLNRALASPGNFPATRTLERIASHMEQEFEQIDESLARKKAKSVLQKVIAESSAGVSGSCENLDFEQAGLVVREIRLQDPFLFLPWVRAREKRAQEQIETLLKDKPFTYEAAGDRALEIIEKENFLPDTSDKRVKLRVEIVGVQNCTGGKLDLVYRIYSTQITPVLSGSPESRSQEKVSPQTPAGQSTVVIPEASPFSFKPVAGYDQANLFYGGGRLEITPRRKLPFTSLLLQGWGSSKMHTVSAAFYGSVDRSEGSTDASKWLAHGEWWLNFENFALPTGTGQIKGTHLTASFSGTSKPLAGGNVTLKFGGLVEGGNRQSDVQGIVLSPDTVPSESFGALKLYAGVDSRLRHQVLSAAYGLELGSIGPATRIDWQKHIFDLTHEFWYPIGDHHLLDLESHLTFGKINVSGQIPLPERFFGGNNEEWFIPGDTLQIRANPVIRAIPGNRFFRTAEGPGGKEFFSYNLTTAYAVWRKALVPPELTQDPDFNSELEGAITTVTSTLQNYYASKDTRYATVVGRLPGLQSELENLKNVVAAAQVAHPGQSPDLFKACTRSVSGALRRLNSAITPSGADQFSLLFFLLSDDPDEITLLKVTQSCGRDLNGAIADPNLSSAAASFEQSRVFITDQFKAIDQDLAARKASADMKFTRRTLSTLFKEVNIFALSPVFVFDVAKIDPAGPGRLGGVRYGPGGGIRFELASVAHFTFGYARNIREGPGEGKGNFFFTIGVRDLFH